MKNLASRFAVVAIGALATFALVGPAAAEWPERPVQIVVPFGAGGDTDFNARMFSKYLEPILGVPLPVVNVTGAGGSVGARQAKDAAPDGYTVLFFHEAMLVNEASGIADFSFRDFELAAIAAREPGSLIVVRSDAPYKTLEELIKASQENPGGIDLTINIGATTYLVGQLLNKAGGAFNFVDVGGSAGRLTAILGGNVDVSQNPLGQVKPYLDNGELRALATLRPNRSPAATDVPTASEEGYDVVFQYDYFFLFPKGTAQGIVDKFAAAVEDVVAEPQYAAEIEERYLQEPVFLKGEAALQALEEADAVVRSVKLN